MAKALKFPKDFCYVFISLRKKENWLLCFNCLLVSYDVSLPHGAVDRTAVCDSVIFWSYSLTFKFDYIRLI